MDDILEKSLKKCVYRLFGYITGYNPVTFPELSGITPKNYLRNLWRNLFSFFRNNKCTNYKRNQRLFSLVVCRRFHLENLLKHALKNSWENFCITGMLVWFFLSGISGAGVECRENWDYLSPIALCNSHDPQHIMSVCLSSCAIARIRSGG